MNATEQQPVEALPIGLLMPAGDDHKTFREALEEEARRVRALEFLEKMEAAARQREA